MLRRLYSAFILIQPGCACFDCRWYNPAVENQATDRAFRIGQQRRVFVHKLICSATFEEKIDKIIDDKRELAELSVKAGEKWVTDMTDAELQNLFALSAGNGNDD